VEELLLKEEGKRAGGGLPHLDFSFPEKRRLKKSGEIIGVFKKGKRIETPLFSFIWRKNEKGYDRFAVVVNKKFGNAVERNRGKRLMKEIFRQERRDLGIDIVVYLKKELKSAEFEDIRKTFRSCLEKIK